MKAACSWTTKTNATSVWKCYARWAAPIFTFGRDENRGCLRFSLWLSRDPPLKLRGNLVEPLFRLLRSFSIDLNLDLQLSNAIR
jgi:hypothetical protein